MHRALAAGEHLLEALQESAERLDTDQVARRVARQNRVRRLMLSPAKGTRDVHRAPAGGEPGPRLRHAARRTARQKRERYHLLPQPTGARDLRQAPAGGTAGERGLHGPRPSGVKTRGLSRCETKKNTRRHLLQCATGTRDMRRSPAGERGAPDPRPSGFRKRDRRATRQKKWG